MQEAVFSEAARALANGDEVAIVTIVSARGSTPQQVGAKMLVYADGRQVSTIGGGCYESDACGKARHAIRTRCASLVSYELTDDMVQENGLICGGQMQVFIDPLESSPPLYLVGAGHVSQQAARIASMVGFRVHVLDDRDKFANQERFPDAASIIVDDIEAWLAGAEIPASAFVVVVTRGHSHDFVALKAIAGRSFRYVGMIGSRAKVKKITDALADEGVSPEWIQSIYAPIGLAIGAVTPEEIAVSIVSELIAVRRQALPPATAVTSLKTCVVER